MWNSRRWRTFGLINGTLGISRRALGRGAAPERPGPEPTTDFAFTGTKRERKSSLINANRISGDERGLAFPLSGSSPWPLPSK